jgi:hypothetical protein
MTFSIPALSAVYHRDPSVPYWKSNTDVDALFEAHQYRPERAQAWLRYREVSETCHGFEQAVTMRGHFEAGSLGAHTYHWTFTPTFEGDPAIVLPVHEQGRLVDLLAIARHDYRIWGCTIGAGQYVGKFANPLPVHDTPYSWLMSDCDGVLPLAKAFFPLMQFAPGIIAQDASHAWDIAHQAFIYPAERFGLDCDAAEQAAFDRISFDEAAI